MASNIIKRRSLGESIGGALGSLAGAEYKKYGTRKRDEQLAQQAQELAAQKAGYRREEAIRKEDLQRQQSLMFDRLKNARSNQPVVGPDAQQQGQPGQFGQFSQQDQLGQLGQAGQMQQPPGIPGAQSDMNQPRGYDQRSQKEIDDETVSLAAQSGFSIDNQVKLAKELAQARKEEFQERSFQSKERYQERKLNIAEEAPERKQLIKDATEVRDEAKYSDQIIENLRAVKSLAESGKSTKGIWDKVTDRLNISEFNPNSGVDLAGMLIANTNIASAGGKKNAAIIKEWAKANPDINMTAETQKVAADYLILNQQLKKARDAELNKIRKENGGKRLPTDAMYILEDRMEPITEKISKKRDKLLSDFIKSAGGPSSNQLSDPRNSEGKIALDNKTGKVVVSNGEDWVPYDASESVLQSAKRNITGLAAEAGSVLGSVPGETLRLIHSGAKGVENLTRNILPEGSIPELTEQQQKSRELTEKLISKIPSYQDVKDYIGSFTEEGYLKPRNEYEKLAQDFTGTLTSLLIPIGPATKAAKAVKLAAGSNLSKFAAKKLGFGETVQQLAGAGFLLANSLFGKKAMDKKVGDIFDATNDLAKKSKPLSSSILKEGGTELLKEALEMPTSKAAREEAMVLAGTLSRLASKKQIPVDKLLEARKRLNNLFFEGNNETRPFFKKAINMVEETLKQNPKVYELTKAASNAWSTLKTSQKGMEFLNSVLGGKDSDKYGALKKLGLLGWGAIRHPKKTALGVGALGLNEVGKKLAMFKDPLIQKLYLETMKAAFNENKKGLLKSAADLNNALERKERKMNKEDSGRYTFIN